MFGVKTFSVLVDCFGVCCSGVDICDREKVGVSETGGVYADMSNSGTGNVDAEEVANCGTGKVDTEELTN